MVSFKSLALAALPLLGLAAADTLTAEFYSGDDCQGSPFQTFTIGNIDSCHTTSQTFKSYAEVDIATSFFGRDLRFWAFTGAGCTGTATAGVLTNNALCWVDSAGYNSFMIASA